MRTNLHRAVLAAVALLALTSAAAAQGRESLLATIEVKRLAASIEASDQARLRDHFTALAEQYSEDAKRHDAFANGFVGNPNRRSTAGPGSHSTRLAKVATESAAAARQLAAHFGRLADGEPSSVPANSARFLAGEGAPEPTDAQLRELSASAKTPADHALLQEHFVTVAAKHNQLVVEHSGMAAGYRINANRRTLGGDPVIHCERMIKKSKEAAMRALAHASQHRQLTYTH